MGSRKNFERAFRSSLLCIHVNVYRAWRPELVLLLVFALLAANAASNQAEYIGGTVPEFQAGQEGKLEMGQSDVLRFGAKSRQVSIDYTKIHSLEYGQKVDRRYIEAVLVSPLFLLSKKRAHYLTIHFQDAKGIDQAMVLKIPKSAVRPTLASLEARTGLKVKVQDDEARKAYRG